VFFGAGHVRPDRDKSFRKDLQISSKKFGPGARSKQDANVVPIAENHDLPRILNSPVAAPLHLAQEPLASDQSFDICDTAADYAAFGDCAG
jgi:hypothetical protein